MTSNFDFLKPHYPKLHQTATQAEKLINNAPGPVASTRATP